MDPILVMVIAICITSIIGWSMQRYELGKIAKMFEDGNKRTQQMIAELGRLMEDGNKRTQQMMMETQRLIDEGRKETREILNKMDERLSRMDERFEALLKTMNTHMRASTKQHKEILEKLKH